MNGILCDMNEFLKSIRNKVKDIEKDEGRDKNIIKDKFGS